MKSAEEYQFPTMIDSVTLSYELMAGQVLNGSKNNDPFGVIWSQFYETDIMTMDEKITLNGQKGLSLLLSKMVFDHSESIYKSELLEMYRMVWDNPTSKQVYTLVSRAFSIAGALGYYR